MPPKNYQSLRPGLYWTDVERKLADYFPENQLRQRRPSRLVGQFGGIVCSYRHDIADKIEVKFFIERRVDRGWRERRCC